MAYSVGRRTREIGIRMALGAERSDVMLLVLKKATLLLAFGLFTGLAASWFATRALQAFLFGVGRYDPITSSLRLRFAYDLRFDRGHNSRSPRRLPSNPPVQTLRTE